MKATKMMLEKYSQIAYLLVLFQILIVTLQKLFIEKKLFYFYKSTSRVTVRNLLIKPVPFLFHVNFFFRTNLTGENV